MIKNDQTATHDVAGDTMSFKESGPRFPSQRRSPGFCLDTRSLNYRLGKVRLGRDDAPTS